MDDGSGAVSGAGIHSATHAEAEAMAIRRSLMTDQYELIEALDDLVHDVAKYMVFEVRFLHPMQVMRRCAKRCSRMCAALGRCAMRTVWCTQSLRGSCGVGWCPPSQESSARPIHRCRNESPGAFLGRSTHDWRAVAAAVRQTSDDIRGLSQHVRNTEEGAVWRPFWSLTIKIEPLICVAMSCKATGTVQQGMGRQTLP